MGGGTGSRKKVGLIVNPVAGIGGRVGLKGSDGRETVRKARELGGESPAPGRAATALKELVGLKDEIELVTYHAEMGESVARECGFVPEVFGSIEKGNTTPADTRAAARGMEERGVDLIIFVGGDGTARDICEAVDERVPALGVPAGVKIHSSVYAVNAQRAGELAREFLQGRAPVREMEVMDIDEDLFRQGRVSARLYGYLKVPFKRQLVQRVKAGSAVQGMKVREIAEYVADRIVKDDCLYVLGPGTTVKAVADALGIEKTLLGVDVIQGRTVIGRDVGERQLAALVEGKPVKIVVTVIGGQGYIFGRGNQQISPTVIRMAGKSNIIVIATQEKLASLDGPLLVDTGDPECDRYLTGYIRVVTGHNEETVWKVAS